MTRIFIWHHPENIFIFKNLIKIIKDNDPQSKIILFKVNHQYFDNFDFKPFCKYFDEIAEFDFVLYRRNFLKGCIEMIKFKKQMEKAKKEVLIKLDSADLFLFNSGWPPVNLLYRFLAKCPKIKNITKFSTVTVDSKTTKVNIVVTFLCNIYNLLFGGFLIKVLYAKNGEFMDFRYLFKTPGRIVTIKKIDDCADGKDFFPFPFFTEKGSAEKPKNIVFIFGDATFFSDEPEYFPPPEIIAEKLNEIFSAIKDKYKNCKIYYKPHPADQDRIMPGINNKDFIILDNKKNAQILIDENYQSIKAVYTLFSMSVITSAFLGIPSYTFYKIFPDFSRADGFFSQKEVQSKFLYHISHAKEVGAIDDIKRPNMEMGSAMYKKFRALLNV